MEERDAVVSGDRLRVTWILTDGRDVHRQLADAMTIQQVFEAVVVVRDHDEDPRVRANQICHSICSASATSRNWRRSAVMHLSPCTVQNAAHEEPLRDRVVELLHFDDVKRREGTWSPAQSFPCGSRRWRSARRGGRCRNSCSTPRPDRLRYVRGAQIVRMRRCRASAIRGIDGVCMTAFAVGGARHGPSEKIDSSEHSRARMTQGRACSLHCAANVAS
jgi:hypothetical protein